MSPPSSTDSGPVPQVFSPPTAGIVTASSVPAETRQGPPSPAPATPLPFSNAPHPSVIATPAHCQSPASPVHQTQSRPRIRSRTPPLSLRPSHFATSIIPQNTRRRLRLRRSLNNASPIASPHNRNSSAIATTSATTHTNNSSNIDIDTHLSNETVSNSPPPWSSLRTPQPPASSVPPSSSNFTPSTTPDPFVHNPHPTQSLTQAPRSPAPITNNNSVSCSVPLPPHPLSQFGPSRSTTVPYSSTQQPPTAPNNQQHTGAHNAQVRPAIASSSLVPRSSAIDELIAVLERNAPPLPAARNFIARTQLPPISQNQQNDNNAANLSHSSTQRPNTSSFSNAPGVAAPSYSGSAVPASHLQQSPDAPGLACIPSVQHPSQFGTVNTTPTNRQSSALDPNPIPSITPNPQPSLLSAQRHSEYPQPVTSFIPTSSMINQSNNNSNNIANNNSSTNPNQVNVYGGIDRSRWHPSSGAASPPASNSSHPLPTPSVLDTGRPSSSQPGTSSGYGPPHGVPTSLWPMPPLTRENMLPRVTSGPVQRGISPYRSSLRHSHLSHRAPRPYSRDAPASLPVTSASPNNGPNSQNLSLPPFTAHSLRSVERQSADLDAALIAAQAAAAASVARLGGNTDDDLMRDRVRGRERERERDRSRRISDIVMDDEVVLVGTSTNPLTAGPSRLMHASSSVAGNNGYRAGSSGRRSVSFNVGAGSSSAAGSMSGVPFDVSHDERRENDDGGVAQSNPFSAGAPSQFAPPGSGWGPSHDNDNSYGEHLRRARLSRVIRMMGNNSSRRAAQVSDDMRLIFGNDEEAMPPGADAMNAIGFRGSSNNHPPSTSATARAMTSATGNIGVHPSGYGGGPGGGGVGVGGGYRGYGNFGAVGGARNHTDALRSFMVSEDDSDIVMNELDAVEYMNSINLHPRHRDRERDRDRDRDRERGRERSQLMRMAARGGAFRQMTRISRMPPMESMLRRCEVRAMVAGREFGVPCGLFEYSVRGRPSLTPTIDWPDVMLISDENVKPRGPILDLMAESHVNWCVRVGPLGNGEGDGRRGYQAFVTGLMDGGFAIELQVTRGAIYLWALTFPPHGQCLLGVFRPDKPPCTSNKNENATSTGRSVPVVVPRPAPSGPPPSPPSSDYYNNNNGSNDNNNNNAQIPSYDASVRDISQGTAIPATPVSDPGGDAGTAQGL